MYFIFRILPIIIMIPLAIYFYFFIKRICLCIFQNINKWHKIICALLAVVFVLPASSFFSFCICYYYGLHFCYLQKVSYDKSNLFKGLSNRGYTYIVFISYVRIRVLEHEKCFEDTL